MGDAHELHHPQAIATHPTDEQAVTTPVSLTDGSGLAQAEAGAELAQSLDAAEHRYAPMELSAQEEPQLRATHLDALVDTALSLFETRDGAFGPQDTPSAFTKNNNPRAMHTANGVLARARAFTAAHISPTRVRARNRFVAMAQDRLTIAVEEHGIDAVIARLAQILVARGPPDSDEDEDW